MGSVFMTGLALALALNAATVWFFLPELSFADLKKLGGAAVLDPKTAGAAAWMGPAFGGILSLAMTILGVVIIQRASGSRAKVSLVASAGLFQLGCLLLVAASLASLLARPGWVHPAQAPAYMSLAEASGAFVLELQTTQMEYVLGGGSASILDLYDGFALGMAAGLAGLAAMDLLVCGAIGDPIDLAGMTAALAGLAAVDLHACGAIADQIDLAGAAEQGVYVVNISATLVLALVALKFLFPPLALLLLAAWVAFLASFALASLA
ncbi:hypothetical protein T484DRAFT_1875323 [Baffinella frigidus]|nr:hypothetical protein T484DRAFT_1875323 [Cryptophyta sp. CCMP2293]